MIYCASLLNSVQIIVESVCLLSVVVQCMYVCECCVQLTYGDVSPADLLQCTRQPVVVYLLAVKLQPVLQR